MLPAFHSFDFRTSHLVSLDLLGGHKPNLGTTVQNYLNNLTKRRGRSVGLGAIYRVYLILRSFPGAIKKNTLSPIRSINSNQNWVIH